MKISKMIKNLQEFMKYNGDIECWYATDDEGNGYNEIHYTPSLYFVTPEDEVYQEVEELLDELGIREEDMEEYGIRPICIVN